ncbi:general secretion pathway protein D [Polaromonas sp. YR568]|uniref:cohesin domain-containing protein n=1 Tax=Polaromonas sp. YR568 TaxID=1855301 RepID=UPI0008F0876D|nr:cohesin domain-containing protein [Polaromonas sp. YR568]SFV02158.1 general secretion pathway protein D [Polaromonas sp. YR568]
MKLRTLQLATWSSLASFFVLTGCAQFVRDDVNAKMRQGDYEGALQGIQEGLVKYPDNTALRATLVSVQNEAVSRLVAQAIQYRATGRFDDADNTLLRAQALDPKNDRILALQNDITAQRRAEKSLDEALTLMNAKNREQALRVVEKGLRDSPRQPELLALQRRLEAELRFETEPAGRRGLAENRPITLDFRNAPLSTVLEAITRGSGINFILDRDVKQDNRVTLYLRSAKVDDAIDLVVGAHQLSRRTVDPQTVLIYPNTPEKQREHQEQVIRVFHLGNAEAKSTAALLRNMLRIKDPFVDERANLIALRESPEIIALAERLVALHDIGDAEVMMEVEILEVKTARLTELGINFPNSLTLTPLPLPGATGLTVSSVRSLNSERIGVGIGNTLINLRREVGDFNVLANPRIRAKNREKAKILIGDKVPVVTTSSTATFLSESISFLDVGIKLEVEPVVSPDDEVSIKLGLEVSSIAKEVRTAAGSLAYQIGTRNANTVLRLRDGETQLLGGLISNEDRSSANRVPGLGDMPVLGRLFSSQKDDYQRTELILAITPRILRSAPHPDISQAEMWVGSEMATRLRASPARVPIAKAVGAEVVTASASSQPATVALAAPAGTSSDAASAAAKAVAAAGPIVASWKAPAEVKAGTEFVVTLNLSSGAALRGAPLEISFPAQSLEVLDVTEGSFFKQSGATTSFTQAVNTTTGRIGAGILSNDSQGATGQGSLLQLRLKAKSAGPVDLGITSLKPIALSGGAAVGELPALRLDVK